jgi:hypothetical protein
VSFEFHKDGEEAVSTFYLGTGSIDSKLKIKYKVFQKSIKLNVGALHAEFAFPFDIENNQGWLNIPYKVSTHKTLIYDYDQKKVYLILKPLQEAECQDDPQTKTN